MESLCSGIRVSVHRGLLTIPNDTPLKFRLKILVESPSYVVQVLSDSAAVVIEDICVESLVEVTQCQKCFFEANNVPAAFENFLLLVCESE